jgi:hypothetical protein
VPLLCGKTPRTGCGSPKTTAHWLPLACPCCVIAGAIEYKDGSPASCGNLEASSASPASCNSHFGYAVCVLQDERARIADATTNPTAKPSSGVAQQPGSAAGAFPQSVPSDKRREEGISLHCAIDQEEANPYSASRDITPAASTRVSYNWRNNPGSPNSEPLQVCHSPLIASVRAAHCTGAAVWQCASIQASWLPFSGYSHEALGDPLRSSALLTRFYLSFHSYYRQPRRKTCPASTAWLWSLASLEPLASPATRVRSIRGFIAFRRPRYQPRFLHVTQQQPRRWSLKRPVVPGCTRLDRRGCDPR